MSTVAVWIIIGNIHDVIYEIIGDKRTKGYKLKRKTDLSPFLILILCLLRGIKG